MDKESIETLFSFEVHVERIEELRVCCRLPAVSFRLLDFPTLVIHHLSPGLTKKMRQKVEVGAASIDTLLSEIKDRHGNFQIQKGKSCLLKVKLNDLHNHLQSVPMYVMLIDLWPEKSKLVGSTTVTLKDAINAIHRKISRNGIAVPAFFREENTFPFYNLMGSVIGKVKLGYKLLSLGGALLPHVPRLSLIKRQIDGENYKAKPTVDISNNSLKVEEKKYAIEVPPQPHVKIILTETQNVHVQTEENKTQDRNKNMSGETDTNDDLFVTNIICPPPLYYNFHSDTQPETVSEAGKLTEDAKRQKTQKSVSLLKSKSPYDVKTTDVEFRYYKPGVIQKDRTVMYSSVAVQTDICTPNVMIEGHDKTEHGDQNVDNEDKCFPLLNGLLEELASVAIIKNSPKSTKFRLPKETIQNKCREQNISVVKKKPLGVLTGKKLTDTERVYSRGKSAMIGPPKDRPRFHKSNLTYKMTKTQLMRLEMNRRAGHGREMSRRLCVVFPEDVGGKTQEQKPSSAKTTFGAPYKINLKQEATGKKRVPENDATTTKQFISTEMQTEDNVHFSTSENHANSVPAKLPGLHSEPQQFQFMTSSDSIVHSSVGGYYSPVESNRSYKSQSSLEVYLPTMDGNFEERSNSDKDLSSEDDD